MASDRIKGSADRLVTVPGYHIHPQYDLVHLRHLLNERRHRKKGFALNLAPMVDMFSILVIYLIMNFSSSGEIFFVSKQVALPKASRGTEMKSFPIISIVGEQVVFDAEEVDGEKSVSVSELNDMRVPQLRQKLRTLKRIEAQLKNDRPKGQVNLQADIKTPVDEVKKVMRVLIEEGWTGINFIVEPHNKK